MRHNDDRGVLFARETEEPVPDRLRGVLIKVPCRFVRKNAGGRGHDRAGNRGSLPLAT